MIRAGAPEPPPIFIGNVMTVEPEAGNSSMSATFSRAGIPCWTNWGQIGRTNWGQAQSDLTANQLKELMPVPFVSLCLSPLSPPLCLFVFLSLSEATVEEDGEGIALVARNRSVI